MYDGINIDEPINVNAVQKYYACVFFYLLYFVMSLLAEYSDRKQC